MTGLLVIVAIVALAVIAVIELVAAALPVVIVITMVPPHERDSLARLLAICDSSRKLRLSSALRVAVLARREELRSGRLFHAGQATVSAWHSDPLTRATTSAASRHDTLPRTAVTGAPAER